MDELGPFADPAMVRRLVDDGMVLFLAVDGAARISWIGRSSLAVLGHPADELVGRSALDLLHPDDGPVLVGTLAETARNSEERILAVVRVRHADGHWITLEFGGIDLRDVDGEGTFLVWGRSYESASRLTAFLEALLAGQDLGLLLAQVVDWCDALAPYSNSLVLGRDEDGRYSVAAASTALPPALGVDLVLDAPETARWLEGLGRRGPQQFAAAALPGTLPETTARAGIHAAWISAVDAGDQDRPDGLVISWRLRPGEMMATHQRHLLETCRLIQVAFEWSRSHQDLLAAATTDALTGLANRTQLRSRVAVDDSRLAALLFCDLDDFKGLNDEHGHAVGDLVLRGVAERMAASLRPEDLLVRLGGDEFAVWCSDLRDPAQAEAIAARLLAALEDPVEIDGVRYQTGCSIGIAVVDDEAGAARDVDRLLVLADQALYRAKDAGRGRSAT